MKKLLVLLLLLSGGLYISAQVAINKDGSAPASGSILHVKGSAGEFFVKESDGYVGIGTTSPVDKLHVSDGNIRVTDGSDFLTIQSVSGNNFEMVASNYLDLGTTSYRTLTIRSSNRVGIGTNDPGELLDVHGKIWVTGTGKSVFIGENAGNNDDYSDGQNVAVGTDSYVNATTGEDNVSLGYFSMNANTTGSNNVSVGAQSLLFNKNGNDNVAIGFKALKINGNPLSTTSTSNNIAIGAFAMEGYYNIFPSDFPTGSTNVAIGLEAYKNYSDGSQNVAVGAYTLSNNKDGGHNVAVGYQAGPDADHNNTTAIGNQATTTKDNQIVLGNGSVTELKTAANMFIDRDNGYLILKDAGGGCHAIRVDNANNITATTVACP